MGGANAPSSKPHCPPLTGNYISIIVTICVSNKTPRLTLTITIFRGMPFRVDVRQIYESDVTDKVLMGIKLVISKIAIT